MFTIHPVKFYKIVLGPILYPLYMSPWITFFAHSTFHSTCTLLTANYIRHLPVDQHNTTRWIVDIKNFLNKLKLNRETEFVIFHPTHRQQIIQPSNSIKKLGCCLWQVYDYVSACQLSLQIGLYHIRIISRIRRFLTTESTEILVNA